MHSLSRWRSRSRVVAALSLGVVALAVVLLPAGPATGRPRVRSPCVGGRP